VRIDDIFEAPGLLDRREPVRDARVYDKPPDPDRDAFWELDADRVGVTNRRTAPESPPAPLKKVE
jgi:hypothetical protein